MFKQQPIIHVQTKELVLSCTLRSLIAFRCTILNFCQLTWILTRPAKLSRQPRRSLRQRLFSGYQGGSVQLQLLVHQSQVQRSPRSRVDGVGPATEKSGSRAPSNLHHTQRICRFTNGQPQTRGRPFPYMPGHYATQTPTTTSSVWSIWPTKLLPRVSPVNCTVCSRTGWLRTTTACLARSMSSTASL